MPYPKVSISPGDTPNKSDRLGAELTQEGAGEEQKNRGAVFGTVLFVEYQIWVTCVSKKTTDF